MDIDRGDFPHPGLIDRRGNLNLAGRYLRSLLSVLATTADQYPIELAENLETDIHTCVSFQQGSQAYQLYLVREGVPNTLQDFQSTNGPTTLYLDLQTGQWINRLSEAPISKAWLVQLERRRSSDVRI